MDNTNRFSDRVQDYVKYRPAYPKGLIELLANAINFDASFVVADIGSGTGISSLPFLENGNQVYSVEPNKEMRLAAEELFSNEISFSSIDGTAEDTNLPNNSIDIIFCGQAFHWFDVEKSKVEFARILKNNGRIVLCWNQRNDETPFLNAYNQMLLDCISDYSKVNHRNISDVKIEYFFFPREMTTYTLENAQYFNLEALKGRLKSSSYCPKEGKEHDHLMESTSKLFNQFQKDGIVKFDYKTHFYIG